MNSETEKELLSNFANYSAMYFACQSQLRSAEAKIRQLEQENRELKNKVVQSKHK